MAGQASFPPELGSRRPVVDDFMPSLQRNEQPNNAADQSSTSSLIRKFLAAGLSRNCTDGRQYKTRGNPSSPFDLLGYRSYSPPRLDIYELESMVGCSRLSYNDDRDFDSCCPASIFGSEVERKARNPEARSASDFQLRPAGHRWWFLVRFFLFLLYCFGLRVFYPNLSHILSARQEGQTYESEAKGARNAAMAITWTETIVTSGVCLMVAQGFHGVRIAREHMERINSFTYMLAYAFLKSCGGGTDFIVYECLALLAAYPVVLLHELRLNDCEPDVTGYCREVAKRLSALRNGSDDGCSKTCTTGTTEFTSTSNRSGATYYPSNSSRSRVTHQPSEMSSNPVDIRQFKFKQVDYFFEVFALQLHSEYQRQKMRVNRPSTMTNHIACNLNSHIDNFSQHGGVCERLAIMREIMDRLCQAGQTARTFSKGDVCPVVFLNSIFAMGCVVALAIPFQRSASFLNPQGDDSLLPTWHNCVMMMFMSTLGAVFTSLLLEMRSMWDPYGKAINEMAWIMGNASAIDYLLHDYYDQGEDIVRAHEFYY
ncbi:hypothetical protein CDD80_2013 [Ophiocordyceps camponoti-rufipedis]|uniref:Uncharacterized protein n=1 Tax=Ophiocordyceps camponoti-rufipedis TaxID=2004952 RepID=A0A2C5YCQ8_9HYPO|nr:hypothetical protein CDD80_2013 [Ophiocordyceps camponoti-rufipedis]